MSYDFKNYKKDAITRPRDIAWSNWAKFEKVGDMVQGYVRDAFYRAPEGQYQAQRGITIEQEDGTLINVGIKRIDFVLQGTDDVHIGDPLTIKLEELKPSATKGFSPTKIFGFYSPRPSLNPEAPTVKQLDDADFKKGGSTPPPEDTKAEEVPFP